MENHKISSSFYVVGVRFITHDFWQVNNVEHESLVVVREMMIMKENTLVKNT